MKKITSYILCNKGIIVNSYKLHLPSSHFSSQPNKGKPKSFLSSKHFPPSQILLFLSMLFNLFFQ